MIERAMASLSLPGLEMIGLVGLLIGTVLVVLLRGALRGIGVALAVGLLLTRRTCSDPGRIRVPRRE